MDVRELGFWSTQAYMVRTEAQMMIMKSVRVAMHGSKNQYAQEMRGLASEVSQATWGGSNADMVSDNWKDLARKSREMNRGI